MVREEPSATRAPGVERSYTNASRTPKTSNGSPGRHGGARHPGPPSTQGAGAGQRAPGNWAAPPQRTSRHSGMSRRSQTHSMRRSVNSRTGDAGEGGPQFKVIDEKGVNRTPKPLAAIVPSAALRAVKGMGMDDTGTPGSEQSDTYLDMTSSVGFGRGDWFSTTESGAMTPLGASESEDFGYHGHGRRHSNNISRRTSTASSIAQGPAAAMPASPGKRQEAASQGEPAAAAPLGQAELERHVHVTLQETDSFMLLDLPGLAVAADSEEGAAVEARNARYTKQLAARETSDRWAASETQTLVALLKHREVQSSSCSSSNAGCQASRWDIEDAHRAVAARKEEQEAEELGVGSLLPSGAAVSTGPSHRPTNGSRTSMSNRASTGSHGGSLLQQSSNIVVNGRHQLAPQASERLGVDRDSSMASWAHNRGQSAQGKFTANGIVAPSGEPEAPEDPLTHLQGLEEALSLVEAAISQNNHLPQLLLYRDLKPGMVAPAAHSQPGALQQLASEASTGQLLPGQGSVRADLVSSSMISKESSAGTMDALSRRSSVMSSAMPHGGFEQSLRGSSASNNGGVALPDSISRAGSCSIASIHSLRSQASTRSGARKDKATQLQHLWSWGCSLTEGCATTGMSWNKANPDLLAAGYAAPAEGGSKEGRVAFWSLKRPGWPLWTFTTRSGVTAVDFSTRSPNILAVGLKDGTVAIYDVKARQEEPAMESTSATGKHSDPVWKVHWLDRGPEREEVLVSVSTDGTVMQWSFTKGLEHTTLIRLKRVHRTAGGSNGTANGTNSSAAAATALVGANSASAKAAVAAAEQRDAFISRNTGGMSFAFSEKDCRMYLAGTEDGWIHKCSTSYSEQYLESYQGHLGPVYQLAWSPFAPQLFLSSSGDWTTRLWQEGRPSPLLTFQSGNDEVNDVQWCPSNSTVFGTVTAGGRLEIWDFATSTLRPAVQHVATRTKMSCLLFAPGGAPVVVAGADNGQVLVFRMHNIAAERGEPPELQQLRLDDALNKNVLRLPQS